VSRDAVRCGEMNTANLTWLDLCSGLGGASQPALDRGWRVIRIDIDRRFRPDIVADVRALPLKPFHVDVLWASPPCQEFSKRCLPWFRNKPNLQEPSIDCVLGVMRAIEATSPAYWIVENVRCARPWLNPLLGPVMWNSTGHVLWGRLPGLIPQVKPHKASLGRVNGSGTFGPRRGAWGKGHTGYRNESERRNSAEIAKIPYEIGEAICRAVEQREGMQFGASL
jgi:hypothetical protein